MRRTFFQPGTTPHRLRLCNKNCYTAERFALLIMSLMMTAQHPMLIEFMDQVSPANIPVKLPETDPRSSIPVRTIIIQLKNML